MKYTLVVGIEYKKYKKPANIRISTDERLIDDFDLNKDIKSFEDTDQVLDNIDKSHYNNFKYVRKPWVQKGYASRKVYKGYPFDDVFQGPMDPSFVDMQWPRDNVPRYFRVYDIDDTHLKNNLKLTVSNSNSDYSNGFMKNSSLIKFPIIALFPKEMTKNNCEKLINIIVKFDSLRAKTTPGARVKAISKVWGNTQNLKNVPLSMISESRVSWPVPNFYKVTHNNKHNASGMIGNDFWVGGSFELELQIKKKHRVRFLCLEGMTTTGMWCNVKREKSYTVASCKQLLNIYNEDQRSYIPRTGHSRCHKCG